MRIDPIATTTYAVTLAAPVVTWLSIQLARGRAFARHRRMQLALLAIGWASVLAIELRIRLAGGSGALIAGAPAAIRGFAHGLLGFHITVAVATYAAWTWLAIASSRRFGTALPGAFSRRHRRVGHAVLAGLCATTVLATGVYVLAFIA